MERRKVIETLPDGTQNIYNSISECAEKTGITMSAISMWIAGKRKNKTNQNKYEYGEAVKVGKINRRKEISSLCWKCENAYGKCSWSKNFEPVKDWEAIPTVIGSYNTKSYCVIKCPEFKEG